MKKQRAALDPVDGLDQKNWTQAGFSISEMNQWGDHFDHPDDAASYRGHFEPADALIWHHAYPARPEVAIAADQAGWTVADVELIDPWIFYSMINDETWLGRSGKPYSEAWTAYAVDLINVGADPGDIQVCLRAGLSMAEIEEAHSTDTIDVDALELMASLRESLRESLIDD